MENFFFIVIIVLMTIRFPPAIFFKEMLDFLSRFDPVSPRETIIWNNHNIRVNGKPISYNNYNSENIEI